MQFRASAQIRAGAILACAAIAAGALVTPVGAASPAPFDPAGCTGAAFKVDKFYDDIAVNGATSNTFDTGGLPICLGEIATYHWNNGAGVPAGGTITLVGPDGTVVATLTAHATAGTGGALVNWEAPLTVPILINGTYTVQDSDPTTWSHSDGSGGLGFIRVFGAQYVAPAGAPSAAPASAAPSNEGQTPAPTAAPGPTSTTGDVPVGGLILAGLIGAGLLAFFFRRRRTGSVTYTHECSLHCDLDPKTYRGGLGHAWCDLRRTKITKDANGQVTSTEVEETQYDFAPATNASTWDTVIGGTPGKVVSGRTRGENASGTNQYYPISKEGYDKAKAWADGTIANPPQYRGATYNCVDYSLDLCRQAGADVPTDVGASDESNFYVGGLINTYTPSNLVAAILKQREKQAHQHRWKKTYLASQAIVCTIATCEICGAQYMEKP